MNKIEKTAEIYRFPLENDIDNIMSSLKWLLEELMERKVIYGFSFPSKESKEFKKGIDFYVYFRGFDIPIQITNKKENVFIFKKTGIEVIFIPDETIRGDKLFSQEKIVITAAKLEKILKKKERTCIT